MIIGFTCLCSLYKGNENRWIKYYWRVKWLVGIMYLLAIVKFSFIVMLLILIAFLWGRSIEYYTLH